MSEKRIPCLPCKGSGVVAQVIGEGDTEWLEHKMEEAPYEFGRAEISAALKSLKAKLRDDKL